TEPTTTQPTTTQPTTTQPTTTQPTTQPPGDVIDISYTVKGKTYIKKLNASALIGPGKLDAKVKLAEGTFAGDLTLPSTKINFSLFGFLPAQANVKIVPAGKVTGTIAADGSVKSDVAVDLVLVNVKVFGLSIGGGPSCKSSTSVALASNPGFNPVSGGTLAGSYEIRPFTNCGMFTSVINSLAAGPGNTLEIALTKK
ncbi:5'-nucleotidase, partial [Actinokineospora sp. HBU206404]|nr:5'-nucleotidase [Actinokineospora xionganensis]